MSGGARRAPAVDDSADELVNFKATGRLVIFFLHIHKTGGQTLGTRLASAFAPEETHLLSVDFRYPTDLERFRDVVQTKKFAESHVFGRVLEGAAECEYVVAVRSPVEQLISLIKHMRREPDHFGHWPATLLPPLDFVNALESHLSNYQTTSILSAFFDLDFEIAKFGRTRALVENLYKILDKIRWLVPTESIDEFTDLWSMENRLSITQSKLHINVAPEDDFDPRPYRDLLLARPQLYAIDSLLHHVAVERFNDYCRRVVQSKLSWPEAFNSRLAFSKGDSWVWLSDNWYDPQRGDGQIRWRFGPKIGGEVRVRRSEGENFLYFDVVGVNGIGYEEIRCVKKQGLSVISPTRIRRHEELTSYCVPLAGLEKEDSIILAVPKCIPPMARSKVAEGIIPLAFTATEFALKAEPLQA